MDVKKSIRDVIIILLIVVVVVLLFKSNKPGPASMGNNSSTPSGQTTGQGDTPMPHTGRQKLLTDGSPIVKLGNHYIGSDWFDEEVNNYVAEMKVKFSESSTEEDIVKGAKVAAMGKGLTQILLLYLADEWKINVDSEVEARVKTFEADQQSMNALKTSGMSFERVKAMWKFEMLEPKLAEHVAGIMNMEPGSEQAAMGYEAFFNSKLMDSPYEFVDPEMEQVFNDFKEFSASQMSSPHGGMMGHGGEAEDHTGHDHAEGEHPDSTVDEEPVESKTTS